MVFRNCRCCRPAQRSSRCHGSPLPLQRQRPRGARPSRKGYSGMAKFFIDRPIFAWVIALFIMVLGGVALTQLPISQYPPVPPPTIAVSAIYPGASALTLEESVLCVMEPEVNTAPGWIYRECVAEGDGSGSITLSFDTGTNP